MTQSLCNGRRPRVTQLLRADAWIATGAFSSDCVYEFEGVANHLAWLQCNGGIAVALIQVWLGWTQPLSCSHLLDQRLDGGLVS